MNAGIAAIERIGQTGPENQRFTVTATGDASVFTNDKKLSRFNTVVFLTGGGDVLDPEQEAGLEAYMEAGSRSSGLHDAARAEPYSDWFTGLIGARPAAGQPTVQRATVEVGDRVHPATKSLPMEWKRPDKWLNWAKNPSGEVHTVARVRESTYRPRNGRQRLGPPGRWCRDYDGGRSFYTGMGGTVSSYDETDFREHLRGALLWTTRLVRADCKATITGNYKAERLTPPNQPGQNDQIGEPHGLVTAPDGRVFYIGRGGADACSRSSPTGTTPTSARARARSTSTTRRPRRSPSPARSPSSATRAAATNSSRSRRVCSASSSTRGSRRTGGCTCTTPRTPGSTATSAWPSGGSPASRSTSPPTSWTWPARRCC
ncbi:hypothetical protein SALBM217S_08526 [Streptomyces griseoloalbus]